MTEHDLQSLILKNLSDCGFIVFRMNVIGSYTKDGRFVPSSLPRGYSDITAYKGGLAYFVEVKTGKNKPTKEQSNFIERMKKAGCRAGVAYSVEDALKICEVIA